jgi:hypothetical protein
MELKIILQELTDFVPGRFPREALQAAIAQREAITPYLLQSLENPPRVLRRMATDENYMLPLYAFYLLAQFRETQAYPLIVAFFSLPGEAPLNATGDFVTEDLDRVLASVFDGNVAPLKRLVRNPRINEFTRNATLRGLVCLVANNLQPRDAVITYFRHLLRGGLERRYSYVWDGLLSACADLSAEELREDLQKAADENLFEDFAWFEEVMARGGDVAQRKLYQDRRYRPITDAIAEMEWWACFKRQPAPPPVIPRPAPPATQKIGRNAPCPCGSGKKYKHCCGRPG